MNFRPKTARTTKALKGQPHRTLGYRRRTTSPKALRNSRPGARRHTVRIAAAKHHKAPERGPSSDAVVIGGRVQALPTDQLLERYHELVDRRLAGRIDLAESFELDCIESRLDVDDEGELSRLADFRTKWERDRSELVASIESLLAHFKAAS